MPWGFLAPPTDRGAWPVCALARLAWCPAVLRSRRAVRLSNGLDADRMARLAAVALPACRAVLGSPAACPARRRPRQTRSGLPHE